MTVPDERIAVVIATRDRLGSLRITLGRLGALPERPRIIVADNGSTDGTPEALRAEFPSVELLSLDVNLGAGRGTQRSRELRIQSSRSRMMTRGGNRARSVVPLSCSRSIRRWGSSPLGFLSVPRRGRTRPAPRWLTVPCLAGKGCRGRRFWDSLRAGRWCGDRRFSASGVSRRGSASAARRNCWQSTWR